MSDYTGSFGEGTLVIGEDIRELQRGSSSTLVEQRSDLEDPVRVTDEGVPVTNFGYPVYE